MPFDFIFPGGAPGAVANPGTAQAPAQGIDTANNVGYLSAGKGWVPQVPATLAKADFTGISATQTTQALYTTPGHLNGQYRISFDETVTTIDGTSVSFGVFTVQFTDADTGGSYTATPASNTANATNTAGTQVSNSVLVNAKAATAITYTLTATIGGTTGRFSIHVRCEFLG